MIGVEEHAAVVLGDPNERGVALALGDRARLDRIEALIHRVLAGCGLVVIEVLQR